MNDTAPVRWGILGTASIAERFVEASRATPAADVVAVASRDLDRARRWAARFGLPGAFGSYEELLGSGVVDAVYVALPNSLHYEWTLRALDAGAPVLCEKPLTVSAAQARTVRDRSAAAGTPVMEAFMYRFHPHFQRLHEMVAAGTIGDVRTIDAVFTFPLDDRDSVVASAALGGGALLDVGCYAIDAIRVLAGGTPCRAHAVATGEQVDDVIAGTIGFDNGVLGRFDASIDSAERHLLVVSGTEGTLVSRTPWVQGRDRTVIVEQRHGEPDRVHEVEAADSTVRMIEHFGSVLRGEARCALPLDESVATMELIDALVAASEPRIVPGAP